MSTSITLLSDAVGVTITAPPVGGIEIPLNVSRRLTEIRAGMTLKSYFLESLGNSLIGCRIELSRDLFTPTFGTLIADYFSRGVADGLNVSPGKTFTEADEAVFNNVDQVFLIRAMIIGNGVLSPIVRSVVLDIG